MGNVVEKFSARHHVHPDFVRYYMKRAKSAIAPACSALLVSPNSFVCTHTQE